jgi:hypothetical protein
MSFSGSGIFRKIHGLFSVEVRYLNVTKDRIFFLIGAIEQLQLFLKNPTQLYQDDISFFAERTSDLMEELYIHMDELKLMENTKPDGRLLLTLNDDLDQITDEVQAFVDEYQEIQHKIKEDEEKRKEAAEMILKVFGKKQSEITQPRKATNLIISLDIWDKFSRIADDNMFNLDIRNNNVKGVILIVLQPLKIDFYKFASNLIWLATEGNKTLIAKSPYQHPDYSLWTPSITKYTKKISRPWAPNWFLAAFPDVCQWLFIPDTEAATINLLGTGQTMQDLKCIQSGHWVCRTGITALKKIAIYYFEKIKPYFETQTAPIKK